MIEIKLVGKIPVKQVGKNADQFALLAADLYESQKNQNYVFISLLNKVNSPIFGFTLIVKQYDSNGAFIKESKYYDSETYCPRLSSYVLDNPISVEEECSALEIEVIEIKFLDKNIKKASVKIVKDDAKIVAKSRVEVDKNVSSENKVSIEENKVVSEDKNVTNTEKENASKDLYEENEDDEVENVSKSENPRDISYTAYKTIPFVPQVLSSLISIALLLFLFFAVAAICNSNYELYEPEAFFPNFWFGH